MPLRLVDDDLDLSLDIRMSWSSREALGIQLQRALQGNDRDKFQRRLVLCLMELLDGDLQAPTAKQIAFATRISRALVIPLPGEALRYRGAMHEFLGRHTPAFTEYCQRNRSRRD